MERVCLNSGWVFREKVHRFAEIAGLSKEWRPVELPHDALIGATRSAQASAAAGYFPDGAWEYRRTITAYEVDGWETIALEFEGIYRDAIITVNGSVAGQRPNGYAGFVVPIDHLLDRNGEDRVEVEAVAHDDSRWYGGGGIYRDAWLLRAGAVHFAPQTLRISTPEVDEGGAVVVVAATVRNRSTRTRRCWMSIEILAPDGSTVASMDAPLTLLSNRDLEVGYRMFIDRPSLWGPSSPDLYRCLVVLRDEGVTIDADSSNFGIRSLAVDPKRGLRINGKPVNLRGACIHHDNGPLGSATIRRADQRRVELLREAGFNAIRSAHHPMSRAMLDACDRLGVLVMDETSDMWRLSKSTDDYAKRFDDWWERDLASMVAKDFNHPSVIMYSIGNEIPDTAVPVGLLTARTLARRLRALDPNRYVTEAVSGILVAGSEAFAEIAEATAMDPGRFEESGVNTQITTLGELLSTAMAAPAVGEKLEESFSVVDVAGYNYMESRFDIDAQRHPHRVIVDTEAHPTDAAQNWPAVVRLPSVIGEFTWTGWDYLGEVGVGRVEYGERTNALSMTTMNGEYPWLTAWCGDLDITGHRRTMSYFREVLYGLRSDPYLAVLRPEHHGKVIVHKSPWAWSNSISSWTWPQHVGSPIIVEIYSDAPEVELSLNGVSLGRQPAGAEHRFRTEYELHYEPGVLEAVAWRDGKPAERTELRSAGDPVGLALRADRVEVDADSSDLSFVDIEIIDVDGAKVTAADRPVRVTLEGPGTLAGLASGRPDTEERFDADRCTTFDGRCLAVIRPTGSGTISLRVTADGLAAAEVRLTSR